MSAQAASVAVPNAGSVLRDTIVPSAEPSQIRQPALKKPQRKKSTGAGAKGGPTARIEQVHFRGNTVFPSHTLLTVVKKDLGKTLSLSQMRSMADRIAAYYHAHGYFLAEAYLPPQKIKGGQLRIRVLEGRYGRKRIDNQSPLKSFVARQLLSPLSGVVSAAPLDRQLLLLQNLPGIKVQGTLSPGRKMGHTDLHVRIRPGKRFGGYVSADNYGSRYTGKNRLGGGLTFNEPLGLGDRLSIQAVTSGRKLAFGRASYDLAVGGYGTRLGADYTYSRYELGDAYASLDAHGNAWTAGLYLHQPLIRTRTSDLTLIGRLDHTRLEDVVASVGTDDRKHSDAVSVGISGDRIIAFGAGAQLRYRAMVDHGRLRIDSRLSRAIDQATAHTEGTYTKLHWRLNWLQRLDAATWFSGMLRGQVANHNLDSSEKMAVGGVDGVRAYPTGEAAADNAAVVQLELHRRLPHAWIPAGRLTPFLFLDSAVARINKNPWPGYRGANLRHLTGSGLGVTWRVEHLSLQGDVAWRLGDETPASGRNRQPRFWLNASYRF